ncbi:MAG: MerR family transcriptional regulator [Rhodocyclaceae bacterium]
MNTSVQHEHAFNISAVERDTGLSKDTLRVWERRYGFPAPGRDDNGDRVYPLEQVEKLRLIRRLLDQGRRPAKIVGATLEELNALLEPAPLDAPVRSSDGTSIDLAHFLTLVRMHRSAELRATLQQWLLKQGLQGFAARTLPALNLAVGQAWMRGELDVPEEHLYTEQVQNVLRGAIGSQAHGGSRPRILLTTFPDELHNLGLLMAEAMLVPEGATCISLGVQTPIPDIATAADAGGFDVVALSFSSAFPLRQAIDGLLELRALLPPGIALWAGGGALQGKQKRLPGVRVVEDIAHTVDALEEWRANHLS